MNREARSWLGRLALFAAGALLVLTNWHDAHLAESRRGVLALALSALAGASLGVAGGKRSPEAGDSDHRGSTAGVLAIAVPVAFAANARFEPDVVTVVGGMFFVGVVSGFLVSDARRRLARRDLDGIHR